jgi:hypothetical protein
MVMRRFVFAFLIVAVLVPVTMAQARTDPPPQQLIQVLSQLKNLDDDSFVKVAAWARAGADRVYGGGREYERVEASIYNLDRDMRYAVVQWLTGSGRHDLYNLRVSDDDIGPQRVGADSPPPTRDLWRQVTFISAAPSSASLDPSNIALLDGFGAARIDGSEIAACVSFQNNAPKTAKRVIFDLTLRDANGAPLGEITLNRDGTFTSGIAIHTPASYNVIAAEEYSRYGELDNCVADRTIAASSIGAASTLSSRVTRVEYSDGTSWTSTYVAPATSPTPSTLPGAEQREVSDGMGNTYSTLPMAVSSDDRSQIKFLSGFGDVPPGGGEVDICVAFRNTAPATATLINVTYSLIGADGSNLGDIAFVRKGSFSKDTDIQTYTASDLISQFRSMNHGFWDNCAFHRTNVAPFYNRAWRLIKYRVTRVEYADGTTWTAPSTPTP